MSSTKPRESNSMSYHYTRCTCLSICSASLRELHNRTLIRTQKPISQMIITFHPPSSLHIRSDTRISRRHINQPHVVLPYESRNRNADLHVHQWFSQTGTITQREGSEDRVE